MNKYLVVIDMQNDFIDGVLGTKEAKSIVPKVHDKIENFDGTVLFTRDVHFDNYLETQEGRNLPIKHCIHGTDGWQIEKSIDELRKTDVIDKPGFGSIALANLLYEKNLSEPIDEIVLVGLCTDVCIIDNAMILKAYLPEVKITVDSSCCAGITPESHEIALKAMKSCQINIE